MELAPRQIFNVGCDQMCHESGSGKESKGVNAEQKQNKKKALSLSPLALREIISYRKDLENLTQSMLMLPLWLPPQFPQWNSQFV